MRVSANFVADDMEVLRQATLASLGFAILPLFLVSKQIDAGLLRMLAISAELSPIDVHAVYPSHRLPGQAARAFADLLHERMSVLPDWLA